VEVMATCRSGMVDIDDSEGDRGVVEYVKDHGIEGCHRM
jgi:hypothetical protein